MSDLEAFFTFNSFGRGVSRLAHGINDLANLPYTVSAGITNLLLDAYGYAKDAIVGPRQSILGDEVPYQAQSGLVRAVQQRGGLEVTGDLVTGTRTHRTRHGFDGYLNGLRTKISHERGERLARSKERVPILPPGFALQSLDGKTVTLTKLEGKVVVISFFGTWCDICRSESAAFDAFAGKFRDDDEVVVLRISNDSNADDVRSWMKSHGYTFDVLMGDAYMRSADIRQVPSAWFLGKDGRIAFRTQGLVENLVAEYSERVSILKEAGT